MEIAQIIANRASGGVISCDVSIPVRDAISLLAEKRIGAVPVLQNGSVVGIFSERDVLYNLAKDGEQCLSRPVGEVMAKPPITIDPYTHVIEALALMTRRRIRHLPVISDGAMVAFISIGDLVKSRIDEVEHEAEEMRNYIQSA